MNCVAPIEAIKPAPQRPFYLQLWLLRPNLRFTSWANGLAA